MGTVRIVKHEAVPDCGSFEVRFPDGRPSRFFYWDNLPSRRLNPQTSDRETALARAKAAARAASGQPMTVWIYVNASKRVEDPDHLKVFANADAAEAWSAENDPEGVAFEYEVIAPPA
jgi:hypothetical protein